MSDGNAGGSLRRFYIIFASVAVVGLGLVGYTVTSKAVDSTVSEPIDLEGADDIRRLRDMAVPVTVGDEDAPATIIIFEDYLCNHCSVFSLRVKPVLERQFVDTGQARIKYYDYVLNPPQGTFLAARAARCAGDQGRFWDYHNTLMRSQRSFLQEPNKKSMLENLAEGMDLDTESFNGCLNSDAHAQTITANIELARALGLPGTPTVLVGTGEGMTRMLSDYALESIQDAVEDIIGGG